MNATLDTHRLKDGLWFAAFVIAYAAAYHFGMPPSRAAASPFWFPDSVLLCAFLKSKPRNWWIFVVASLAIRLLAPLPASPPIWAGLGAFSADTIKMLATAFILRRLLPNPLHFHTVGEFLVFVAVAAIGVPAIAAFPGAAIRAAEGHAYWAAWNEWFMGDAVTQLVVTPVILYWVFARPWQNLRNDAWRLSEACLLAAGLLISAYVSASARTADYSQLAYYAPVPFLFWAAIRFGMSGATGAIAVVAFFEVAAAFGGYGPFAGRPSGAIAIALQNSLLLRSGPLYLIAILIEQRNVAEHSLKESEERFRRMAHSAPMLLWMAGPDKLCNFFNQGWLDFTGRGFEQELGNGWLEGVHPKDLNGCVAAYHEAFDARRPFQIEYRLRRHDGEYRWVFDKGVPRYGADGGFAGYIGSAIDITERKHAEDTNRALEHAQRLAVMGELTAAIAHEVRQPMSAIQLDAQTMEKLLDSGSPSRDAMYEVAAGIRDNVLRVDAVISRIRAFARRHETLMQPLDINAVVLDVTWLIAGEAQKRSIQLRMDLDYSLPRVMGDRTQLQQVLLNLVVNGMEAMAGTAESQRYLVLRTGAFGIGGVEVSVSDHGPGVPSDQLPRLFESFYTTRREGMGLGLSIAKSIIAAHSGHIWAENLDEGARFHVTLPIADIDTRAAAG
jgi:PAS domain S-box-containing protein